MVLGINTNRKTSSVENGTKKKEFFLNSTKNMKFPLPCLCRATPSHT